MEKRKFLKSLLWIALFSILCMALFSPFVVKAGTNITKVTMLDDDAYNACESLAINGNTVYFLKVSSSSTGSTGAIADGKPRTA